METITVAKLNDIDKFLAIYEKHNTIKSYRGSLTKFFSTIGKNPDTYIDRIKDFEAYMAEIRDFYMPLKGQPPLSVMKHISVIRVFLEENHIDLGEAFWSKYTRKTICNLQL